MRATLLLVAALVLGAGSCQEFTDARTDREQAACEASGRVVQGHAGDWTCVAPLRDAGNVCRANQDCKSLCLLDAIDAPTGTCAANRDVRGCFYYIDPTGARTEICVD